jgi:DNA repair protein RadC
MKKICSECGGGGTNTYTCLSAACTLQAEDEVIQQALTILTSRLTKYGVRLDSNSAVHSFLKLKFIDLQHEQFSCIFLNVDYELIEFKVLSIGTLTSSAIYPREVVKQALFANAAFVIFSHNHPTNSCTPSPADIRLTTALAKALLIIDVVVIDHIILGGDNYYSMLEEGVMIV